MKKYVAEFFGTMFLVLLACGSAVLAGPKIGTLGIGLCFGLILFALCYAIGGVSGCHVNPAVSLGVYLTDRNFTLKDLGGYIVAQLAGAAIGLTLGLVNIVGIPVDNCSVNPARSFGPALYSINAWGDFWVMVVGPVIGAVLAALAWKCIIPNLSDPKAAK